jgi:SAM-dependent methyltransferase
MTSPRRVDLFDSTYANFTEQVLEAVRLETYRRDIGQNSWLTADEYDRFLSWLSVDAASHLLEVASGSGGPARYAAERTGCRVTGIDVNENGVATARQSLAGTLLADRVHFEVGDATVRLPFDDATFDAMHCIDSMNHFPDRLAVFREWKRVLKPGGRGLFTDPVVIAGPVTNDELALRSSIGLFLFVPPGVNEHFIAEAGLRLVLQEDVTANAALVSGRWRDARHRRRDDLALIEGAERFEGLQAFLGAVHRLTAERRLRRVVYLVERSLD